MIGATAAAEAATTAACGAVAVRTHIYARLGDALTAVAGNTDTPLCRYVKLLSFQRAPAPAPGPGGGDCCHAFALLQRGWDRLLEAEAEVEEWEVCKEGGEGGKKEGEVGVV